MRVGLLAYLRLYRFDAAAISTFSCLFGVLLAGDLDALAVLVAALIGGVSLNYIYSLNAVTDVRIDQVNRPKRPLPMGEIAASSARAYVTALLVVSLLYPLLLPLSWTAKFLLLLLPLLGYLYSAEPARLKRRMIPANLAISAMYVVPMAIGMLVGGGEIDSENLSVLAYFGLFCFALIPLKDITDTAGDKLDQCQNWLEALGRSRLLAMSASGLLLSLLLLFLSPVVGSLKWILSIVSLTALLTIVLFHVLQLDVMRLYRTILSTIIVEGVVILLLWDFLWPLL